MPWPLNWRRGTTHVGFMAFASRSGRKHFSQRESFVNPYMGKLSGAAWSPEATKRVPSVRAAKGKNTEFRMANIEFFDRTMMEAMSLLAESRRYLTDKAEAESQKMDLEQGLGNSMETMR